VWNCAAVVVELKRQIERERVVKERGKREREVSTSYCQVLWVDFHVI
jgi:hypothetical protein